MTQQTTTVLHIAVYSHLTWCSNQGLLAGSGPDSGYLEYLPVEDYPLKALAPGMRVKVPFGKRELIGVFLRLSDQPQVPRDKLRPALDVLDETPIIPAKLMALALWASDYYHTPIAKVLHSLLPKLLREGRVVDEKQQQPSSGCTEQQEKDNKRTLNPAQQQAVDAINAAENFCPFLLNGVTGSGKTEVYLQAIEAQLAAGKQALVLVPEIALTPQTLSRFKARFAASHLAVLHSALTPKQRFVGWLAAKQGKAAIVIGTRSAIFTPFKKLGLIVLDEEHDASFKQQAEFRYSARDLAIVRGKLADVPVVLGSATPSLESLYNVATGRYKAIQLPERAGGAAMPTFNLIDLRSKRLTHGLSDSLIQAIKDRLEKNEQVLLFLNRRGYSPILMCHTCGWHAGCENCDARMVLYKHPSRLQCHHCNASLALPQQCPKCLSTVLIHVGVGTEQLATTLNKQFPDATIVQVDSDTASGRTKLHAVLDKIESGQGNILVGTQMLAKGHHFPNVTLVAVVDADHGLFSPDFRGAEKMAQLLLQVAGRAGRADKPGEVIIQTHNPRHPLLVTLLQNGYTVFAQALLAERHQANLPPYSYMAALRVESKNAVAATQFLQALRASLEQQLTNTGAMKGAKVHGPIPLQMQRKAGYFRTQLMLQAKSRKQLQAMLPPMLAILRGRKKTLATLSWILDVDPIETF